MPSLNAMLTTLFSPTLRPRRTKAQFTELAVADRMLMAPEKLKHYLSKGLVV